MTAAELAFFIFLIGAAVVGGIVYIIRIAVNAPEKNDRKRVLRRRAELAEETLNVLYEKALTMQDIDHAMSYEVITDVRNYRKELHS